MFKYEKTIMFIFSRLRYTYKIRTITHECVQLLSL